MKGDEHPRHGPGRRSRDHDAQAALEDVRRLLRDRQRLLRHQHRLVRERVWLNRVLLAVVFALVAVVSYGLTVTLPALRRAQDQQVCAYRAVANREASLAKLDSPTAVRRRHRQNAGTFRALERVASEGRNVHCRALINQGRR
jgi:hypothetical protein